MDFGIARAKGLESLTQPGVLVGTPSYMSPEQALGQPLDVRSDIFSLGIVLYEMFTGAKPFQDEETASITAKILQAHFLSPRSINSEVPRSIQRIIKKCLRKKPHKRFESMQELARALGKRIKGMDKANSLKRISDFLVVSELVEAPPADESVVIYRAPGMGTFTRLLAASAVFLLLCTGGGIGYFFWTTLKSAGMKASAVPVVSEPTGSVLTAPTPSSPAASVPTGTGGQ